MTETLELQPTKILFSRLPEAKAKIAKANRRLVKAGIKEQFKLLVGTPFDHKYQINGFDVSERMVEVELEHPSIGYHGWTFVGTLSFEEHGTIVRSVPGQHCDYRPDHKECDQCHTVRNRIDTYVVRNEITGEYRQVGRNCLALFFGIKPILWVFGFEIDEFAHNSSGGGSSHDRRISVRSIVAASMAVSNNGRGYVSAKTAEEQGKTSTKEEVDEVLFGRAADALDWRNDRGNWIRKMREAAAQISESDINSVIDAALNMKGYSDYAENIRILAQGDYVDTRNLGYVVSFVSVYAKAQEKAAEQKIDQSRKNAWLGEKKEKITSSGIVTFVRDFENNFGTSTLIEWRDDEGHTLKWFASNPPAVEVGERIKLQGTVKDHELRNGFKATLLTRCKVVG